MKTILEHQITQKYVNQLKTSLREISILIDKYQQTDNLDCITNAYSKTNNIRKILKLIYNTEEK